MEPPEGHYNFESFLKQKGLSDRTIREYLYYMDKFKNYIQYDVDRDVVYAFLEKNDNNVARAFVNLYLKFLEIGDIILPERTGSKDKSEKIVEYISRGDINLIDEAMNQTANPMRNSLMLAITFQGGLRKQELLDLNSRSFRWNKWKENKEEPIDVIIKGKRNKVRVVNCSPEVAIKTLEYIRKLQGVYDLESKDPIFQISNRRWEQILSNASTKSIGQNVNPHMLRHSFAMYVKDSLGWTIQQISKYLGHKNIQTTMIYARTTDPELKHKFKEGFINSEE